MASPCRSAASAIQVDETSIGNGGGQMVAARTPTSFALVLVVVLGLAACGKPASTPAESSRPAPAAHDAHAGPPQSLADWARGATLFDGLGTFHRTVTTSAAEAQQYFDQGMRLMWAFNHDEATRAFARAAEIDSTCALCYWGVALTVGP